MDYSRPKNLGEASKALAASGAIGLAGGTDLLVHLGRNKAWPQYLVDLKALPELRGIQLQDGLLRLGAATPFSEILDSEAIEHFPALKSSLRSFAAGAIRNRATLGGNLANASPAADTAPPLIVHEALCVTQHRKIPVADLAKGPGQTVLKPGEIIICVELPLPPKDARSFFVKLAPREAMAIAVVNVAGLIIEREGEVVVARIALGSVAPTVIRALSAEKVLEGGALTQDAIAKASLAAAAAASPIDDIRATADYRRRMTGHLLNWELANLSPGA